MAWLNDRKMKSSKIACSNCGSPYPTDSLPWCCPVCTGIYEWLVLPQYDPAQLDQASSGIWRYRHTFGLPAPALPVTLGEGSTPLVWGEAFGRRIGFKLEALNPSGSFKDRGTAVLVTYLQMKGITDVIEDSSGNAGASLAAYTSRAGIAARIFIPSSASGPKRRQIEAYGAVLEIIEGPRSKAAEVVRQQARQGAVYASHAYLPHVLAGYASLAYELFEQLGSAPGTVIIPAGQGNLLLAVGRGFESLKSAGLIQSMPRLIGVQARACAPLWAVFQYGIAGLSWVTEGNTLAEGVRVKYPLRGDSVLKLLAVTDGQMIAVDEEEILAGRDALAHQGLYVEPTSAIVWSALQHASQFPEPIICVLTGSGLKVDLE